ncbi:hypothetical protein Hanom_Chr09g00834231 [Helianthus anomalus]
MEFQQKQLYQESNPPHYNKNLHTPNQPQGTSLKVQNVLKWAFRCCSDGITCSLENELSLALSHIKLFNHNLED